MHVQFRACEPKLGSNDSARVMTLNTLHSTLFRHHPSYTKHSAMAFLFASAPPSYADEQLRVHLASLSTLSLAPSGDFSTADAKATPALETALHELTSSTAPDRKKLVQVLKDLAKQREGVASYASQVDELVEAEVMGRAVVLVWKEVLQALVEGALQLEEERSWWNTSLDGRRGVITYLVQSKSLCSD